jgi:hypothetical protein
LTGAALGFVVGMTGGLVVVLLVRNAAVTRQTLRTTLAQIGQLMTIPGFFFGGPWLGSRLFSSVDFAMMLTSYVVSLAVTFALVAGYPLAKLVIATGNRIPVRGARR